MKKLLALAMLATMCGALFLPLQSATAGDDGPFIPDECRFDVVRDALNSGYELVYADDFDGTVRTGSGSQLIIGTSGDDDIRAGSGHDVICGVDDGFDRDVLRGGSGNDVLISGGDSILYGQSGHDLFLGSDGHDCFGGSGHDTVAFFDNFGCHDDNVSIEEID